MRLRLSVALHSSKYSRRVDMKLSCAPEAPPPYVVSMERCVLDWMHLKMWTWYAMSSPASGSERRRE